MLLPTVGEKHVVRSSGVVAVSGFLVSKLYVVLGGVDVIAELVLRRLRLVVISTSSSISVGATLAVAIRPGVSSLAVAVGSRISSLAVDVGSGLSSLAVSGRSGVSSLVVTSTKSVGSGCDYGVVVFVATKLA